MAIGEIGEKDWVDVMIADTRPLIGRSFVSTSNNVCKFEALGNSQDGGLRAKWQSTPSDKDIEECNDWVADRLDAEAHSSVGKENERTNYAKFRREFGA